LDERRRRGALAALAFALLLAVLVGCGSDTFLGSEEEGSGQGVSLNWFVATQPGGTIQEVAKRCSEESGGEYNVNVELLPTTASDQREQLVRRLGAEDSSVDIIGMDVIWTAEFANAGWLREWSGPEAQQVTKDIFPSVIETASFDGKLYGAPFNSNTELLWYRTDLVEKAPTTWDEMISEAERLNKFVQVQANRYEGFTVWVNAMIESAGTEILSGPETVDLAEGPTDDALAMIGKLANSPAAAPDIDTSTEDTARLGFEAGTSAFMLNYTFALSSAQANAPDIAKNMGAAVYPEVVPGKPAKPPLGGFNLGVSAFSNHPTEAFHAATCLSNAKSQLTATKLDGLPPSNQTLYQTKTVQDAYPGFSDEIEKSIENAGPRPLTPAYSDLSLAIQRSLHPPADIDPSDPTPKYDELRSNLEDAVKREGLL
jgi:multiple sugar transport system substrate-binding protein